ncbi:MAG: hypothetical protein R3B96_02115 [Pirellulaceae bacterium]
MRIYRSVTVMLLVASLATVGVVCSSSNASAQTLTGQLQGEPIET